jgi:2-polyprenyl-3-methyl-5-hydroxy-6-metoxy-1,4-benzoquinol methylase
LKERGMEIWGIEINKGSAEIAGRHLDKVLVGDIATLLELLPNRYFDCIIFNDTLEHLVDPYTVLLKMKEKLSAHGVVVCSIPNVRYYLNLKNLLIKKEWSYEDAGILDRTHLRFFTEKSIRDFFTSLSYQIIRMEGINRIRPSWKFKVMNFMLCGHLSDTLFPQFALVAKVSQEQR